MARIRFFELQNLGYEEPTKKDKEFRYGYGDMT